MAQRPTAGYNIHFDGNLSTNVIGSLLEHNISYEGDTEDVSGTGDTVGDVVRRVGKPVDVGANASFTLILDEAATGYAAFITAMQNRTADSTFSILNADLEGWEYTGHAESFDQSLTRSESVWKASLTFYVNEETAISGS